jgi:hypothetical protein
MTNIAAACWRSFVVNEIGNFCSLEYMDMNTGSVAPRAQLGLAILQNYVNDDDDHNGENWDTSCAIAHDDDDDCLGPEQSFDTQKVNAIVS